MGKGGTREQSRLTRLSIFFFLSEEGFLRGTNYMPIYVQRPLQTLMMPASSSRPKRKSRGDAYLEDNGIGMGGGGGRKEKENSAPAAKKRREEDKQSSKSTATTTTNAPATGSTATVARPKVGSLFYITHSFFYNLLRQLAKGGRGEDCSY